MAKSEATFVEIEVESLTEEQRRLYEAYKDSYRVTKGKRLAFEASMQNGVAEGMRIVCGYNFGKLSIAMVEAKEPKKPKVEKLGLADYMARMAQQGRAM